MPYTVCTLSSFSRACFLNSAKLDCDDGITGLVPVAAGSGDRGTFGGAATAEGCFVDQKINIYVQVNNATLLVAVEVVSGLLVPINDYLEMMYTWLCFT